MRTRRIKKAQNKTSLSKPALEDLIKEIDEYNDLLSSINLKKLTKRRKKSVDSL